MPFCPNCGQSVGEAKFCPGCGTQQQVAPPAPLSIPAAPAPIQEPPQQSLPQIQPQFTSSTGPQSMNNVPSSPLMAQSPQPMYQQVQPPPYAPPVYPPQPQIAVGPAPQYYGMPMQSTGLTPKILGIYKELDPDEKPGYASVTPTSVIFVKEAEIRKVIGRECQEKPISISNSLFYMTSKRIIFLKLFEISAAELGEGENNMLSNVSGTFFEIPLSAISQADLRPVQVNRKDMERYQTLFGGDLNQLRKPALEIVYDEKAATGRAKMYMDNMLQRGLLSRLWGKIERVYDKIFILGEQSASILPQLQEIIRNRPPPQYYPPQMPGQQYQQPPMQAPPQQYPYPPPPQ